MGIANNNEDFYFPRFLFQMYSKNSCIIPFF